MQRASIVVLLVGILIGLMWVRAADGQTVHSLQLQPNPSSANQPVTLTVDLTFDAGGHDLFVVPLTTAPSDSNAHRIDLVYWRDVLSVAPMMLTPRHDAVALGDFASGEHELSVFMHDLTSDAETREALLADPTGFAGPGDVPFTSHDVTQRTLDFAVDGGTSVPEPAGSTLMLLGAMLMIRRGPQCR